MIERARALMLNGVRFAFDWRPGLDVEATWCRRAAVGAIRLWKELCLGPMRAMVDVGARESEFARWIVDEWPAVELVSFEPDKRHTPRGWVSRAALGSKAARAYLKEEIGLSCPFVVPTDPGNQCTEIQIARFDSLDVQVARPAMLKVDAENCTLDAVRGFGKGLQYFSVVVCEVSNDYGPDQPHLHEYSMSALPFIANEMWRAGFRFARVLDCGPAVPHRITHTDIAFYDSRSIEIERNENQ